MSTEASTFSSDVHLNVSSVTLDGPFTVCHILKPSSTMYSAYYMTNIMVLLPLCVTVLYLRLHQWRQHQGSAPAVAMMSHSESFTFHLVVMELIVVLGFSLCCYGVFAFHPITFTVGYCLWTFTWYGEMFFHNLTCVERYLAVVHPITYRKLKGDRGIRIRNICNGCTWLLSTGGAGWINLKQISTRVNMVLYCFTLIIISFCSISVLCVLIRPRPGEQSGERERVDQSKKRAFYTIMAILCVLLLRFVWNMTWASLYVSDTLQCVLVAGGVWFNFPSSLVLPLLFLHRVGLSACSRHR